MISRSASSLRGRPGGRRCSAVVRSDIASITPGLTRPEGFDTPLYCILSYHDSKFGDGSMSHDNDRKWLAMILLFVFKFILILVEAIVFVDLSNYKLALRIV